GDHVERSVWRTLSYRQKEFAMPLTTHPMKKSILHGRITRDMSSVEKVWAECACFPRGKVRTYGAIALALDSTGYRAVGMAMNRNPYAPAVPCHRVVGSDGSLTGFAGGLPKKRRMLLAEGVTLECDRVNLAECLFDPAA